jgi:hypothetical protein
MKSVMAASLTGAILIALGYWLEFGGWVPVAIGGTIAAGVLGVGIWSVFEARHRR